MLSCVICQDGITEYENNNYPWVLSCGHVYHRKCFDQSQTNNCPKCRKIVTSSFRLYPDLLTRDESFTCLIECIQCAEGQLTRQKNVNEQYANYIKSLQDTLKEVEIKYTKLRMSIVRTVKVYHVRTNKLNADLETLQDHNKRLNEELNKSAERVSQHESTITDLQRKLQHEAGESRAMATRLNRKIQGLNREMGQMKSTAFNALRLTRVKEEEISRLESQGRELQANVIKLQAQRDHNEDTKKLSNEESKRRTESDPVVEELANCLDRVLLRKRKSLDEADGPPASEGEKASRIQQRSESGADSSQPSKYIHSLAGEASTSSGPAYTVTATREQENEASETQTVKCQYVRKTLKAVRRKKETH